MDDGLSLPPPLELALAYAPASARERWRGLLALDRRLQRIALGAREAVLAQIKLAWWRERFAMPAARWPGGEPLLAALHAWEPQRAALAGLVDGWEGLVGAEADAAAVGTLVEARAQACAALADLLGHGDAVGETLAVARIWARRDLAGRLGFGSGPPEIPPIRLPRAMRPLAVLAELARSGEGGAALRLARAVRVGLLGR